MSLLWFVALVSLAAALAAWRRARAAARRAEQLSQMYWELKYQHGELRVQMHRLMDPGASSAPSPPREGASASGQSVGTGFIPLSSLKR